MDLTVEGPSKAPSAPQRGLTEPAASPSPVVRGAARDPTSVSKRGTASALQERAAPRALPPMRSEVSHVLLLGSRNGWSASTTESEEREDRASTCLPTTVRDRSREYNQWYAAAPPLHQCDAGVGPGDYFSKTLIASLPEGYTIGLVPCGVNGAPIDLFVKGKARTGYMLPPDNHWATGYEWIVSRAKEAQKVVVMPASCSIRRLRSWRPRGRQVRASSRLRSDLAIGYSLPRGSCSTVVSQRSPSAREE